MQEPILPPDETTQSYVIRLWQEVPGQWRGTIRHVQSESRMAFTQLDQAVRWIERAMETKRSTVAQPRVQAAVTGLRAWAARILRHQGTPVWAMAGMVAVLLIFVVFVSPEASALAGTSVGVVGGFGALLPFLSGLVIGGLAVALWVRSTPRR